MPIILPLIVKGIGSGIGLASEAIAHRKERKLSKTASQQSENDKAVGAETAKTAVVDVSESPSDSDIQDEEYLNDDEAEWALDEAAAELEARFGPAPAYTYHDETISTTPHIAEDSTHLANESSASKVLQPLPCPVILPQRRPRNRMRGFVRAYAPVLEECSGISQKQFLSFLDDLDKSAQTSPVFTVINVAAFAVGFVPEPTVMAVSTAVQFVNNTAQELVSRHGRNTYLDKMNREYFMPKGLFCMIMAFKPDMADHPILNGDLSASDKALVKFASAGEVPTWAKNLRSLRIQSGVVKGELALPESAPLVFPALDAAGTTKPADPNATVDPSFKDSMQTKIKSSQSFIDTYFDRRARDAYAGTYPTSKLTNSVSADSGAEKPYASRYSDPNHPANSGTILGLVTGGRFDPIASKNVWKAEQRAKRRGKELTETDRLNVRLGRKHAVGYSGGASRKELRKQSSTMLTQPVGTFIRKILRPDVLYLTVCNLPSESDMREMKQFLEDHKK